MGLVTAAMKAQMAAHLTQIIGDRPSTVTVTRKTPDGTQGRLGQPNFITTTVVAGLTVAILPATQEGEKRYTRAAGGEVVASTHTMVAPLQSIDTPYSVQAGDLVSDGTNNYEVLFVATLTPGQHQEIDLYLVR